MVERMLKFLVIIYSDMHVTILDDLETSAATPNKRAKQNRRKLKTFCKLWNEWNDPHAVE